VVHACFHGAFLSIRCALALAASVYGQAPLWFKLSAWVMPGDRIRQEAECRPAATLF
jgi:hypothetical protein